MALVRFSDTILVNRLNLADPDIAYQGVVVRVFDGDNEEQLYADVDGIAGSAIPYAITDENGLYAFWVESGSYVFRYSFGGTILGTEPVTIYDIGGLVAALGPFSVDVDGLATGIKALNIATSVTNTLFSRPSVNIAGGTLLYSATPDFATPKPLEITASTLLFNVTDDFRIRPTPQSHAQGLDISMSSPLTGTIDGPFYFNVIEATVRSSLTTGGIPGNPGSGTWAGFQCSVNAGGPNYDADSVMGGSFGVTQTLPDNCLGDKNGLSSGVVIHAYTPGKGYGGSSGMTVMEDGETPGVYGYETDVIIESLNVDHVIGFNSWAGGSKTGISTHAAYAIGAAGGMGQFGNGVAGWKTGFRLFTANGLTNSPMATDGSLFDSDHDATLANIFDMENVTVTGNILKFQYMELTGEGQLTLIHPSACITLGDLDPTNAWLNISPASALKTSMRIQPGVAPTTPISGDIYSNGTHLYWVDASGVAHQLDN